MAGIWGSSGIGKSTIARALFSRLSHHFKNSVFIDRAFISRIKEIYNRGKSDEYSMKLHLQEKFLSEIFDQKDIRVYHLGVVGERLKHHRVLIVLDDLDDRVVLDALAGGSHWFGCGSRIIVITKDKCILRSHEIHRIYEVGLPSKKLALEMLCQFAFNQNSPPDGFIELTYKVVEQAGSLPLGLNVFGSYFRGRDKKYWMDILSRLQTGLDRQIEETLKVSYNGLNHKKDEAIFCHIACLFNGEKVNDIKQLLAYSDLDVNIGIENLVDKSIIRIRWNNNVEMPRLLQELGKEIVRTQCDKPGERAFLVDSKDICYVFDNNTGTENILGISLNTNEIDKLRVLEKAFEKMVNLRFLIVSAKPRKLDIKLQLAESFDYFPSKLRLLCWDGYPMKCMPSKFCPQNLVKLKMRESKLEKLWEGVQTLTSLKYMDFWGSKRLKELPDLSMAPNLEKIDLSYCSSLMELPSSIRNLNKLIKLSMAVGTDLETLSIVIHGCSLLKSFLGISSNISKLLILQPETEIEEVPWWIKNFFRLNHLSGRIPNTLQYISPNTCELNHLEKSDFPMSGALINRANWPNSPNRMSMEAGHICTKLPLPAGSSCSLCVPRVKFINCFNLNQQSFFKVIILLGEEVPSYYTQPTIESSLDNPLFNNSLSQQFFRACLALEAESISHQLHLIRIQVFYCLGGRRSHSHSAKRRDIIIVTPLMYKHMVILDFRGPLNNDYDPLDEVNHDEVYIRFHIRRGSFQINGSSEQFYGYPYPSDPNILAHVRKAHNQNMVNDGWHQTEHGEECGEKSQARRENQGKLKKD